MGIVHVFRSTRAARSVLATLALIACAWIPGALVESTAASAATGSGAHSARTRAVLVKTFRIRPRVQRTLRSTGYATYVFKAPPGRRILSATARIVGAQRHAVAIRSRAITAQLTRYTVNLVFPGEQGSPGTLVVRLALVA